MCMCTCTCMCVHPCVREVQRLKCWEFEHSLVVKLCREDKRLDGKPKDQQNGVSNGDRKKKNNPVGRSPSKFLKFVKGKCVGS